jgi:hypothetical protein
MIRAAGRRAGEAAGGSMEAAIGIALVIIAAVEIFWITRTVSANAPR